MAGDIKNFPGVSVTELGPLPADQSVSVVGASGGGGLPVQITEPIGPNTAADSVSVTLATDEGPINVIVDSSALPTGAATEATLSSLNGKVVAVNTGAVVVSSSALPTGAATSALQTTGNTSLSSIDGKTPALGQTTMAASSPVVIASNQTAVPISAASLPLPTGAATESSLAKLTLPLGSTTSGQSGSLTLAAVTTAAPSYTTGQTSALSLTTAGALRVDAAGTTQPVSGTVAATQSGTWNITNVSGTVSLPTGASTSALQTTGNTTLSTISGQFPATLGQKALTASTSVALASQPYVTSIRNDYASVNVTSGAWVQIVASLGAAVNTLDIFDSSGQTLELGVGAAASETRTLLIYPGGNGRIGLTIASGTRISVRAVSATANVGELDINFIG